MFEDEVPGYLLIPHLFDNFFMEVSRRKDGDYHIHDKEGVSSLVSTPAPILLDRKVKGRWLVLKPLLKHHTDTIKHLYYLPKP